MSDICEFGVAVYSDDDNLMDVVRFLAKGIEKRSGGTPPFVLQIATQPCVWLHAQQDNTNNWWKLSDRPSDADTGDDAGLTPAKPMRPLYPHLFFSGESLGCPPLELVRELSKALPDMHFWIWGTTEIEYSEQWHFENGEEFCIEACTNKPEDSTRVFHRKNGADIDPPLVESM